MLRPLRHHDKLEFFHRLYQSMDTPQYYASLLFELESVQAYFYEFLKIIDSKKTFSLTIQVTLHNEHLRKSLTTIKLNI